MENFTIRYVLPHEIGECLELAKRVFLQFEASDYSADGVKTFLDFADDINFRQSFLQGENVFLVCCHDKNIVGILNTRNLSHVSMVFVEKQWHRKGVATRLFAEFIKDRKLLGVKKITLNSSPYGIPFYHAIGFKDTDCQQIKDGIIFTPMELIIE